MVAQLGLLAEPEDTLLVVIDLQERLVSVVHDRDTLVRNVQKLVKFALLADMPIVLTEQQKLGETLPEIRELAPSVSPISKLSFDCFRTLEFERQIRGLHKNTLMITGIEAHICVLQTVLHAIETYGVHVIADAVSSRSPHDKDIALGRMEKAGAVISSTEAAIFELMQEAGSELFKKVLPLVK